MTRRTAAARARARRAQAARVAAERAEVQPRSRPRPVRAIAGADATPEEAIVVYRDVTRYGWTMRLSLAVALVLLSASTTARDLGVSAPVAVGELGLGFMFLFVSLTGVKHYRALYRMRKQRVWSNSGRFMLLMAGAPFGAFDPEATRRDRILLRVTVLLAVVLLVASLAGGITHR